MELLALEAYQHLRHQPQLLRGRFHGSHHERERLPPQIEEQPVDDQGEQEQVAGEHGLGIREFEQAAHVAQPDPQRDKSAGSEHGEDPKHHPQTSRFQQRRSFAPGCERVRVYAGTGFLRDHGQVFAEVQAGAKLFDRSLAAPHHLGCGGGQQPPRQRVRPGVGSRGAQQLEQGTPAEEVEILSVGVGSVGIRIAGLAGSGPLAVQAGQPALEIRCRAAPALEVAEEAVARYDQDRKHRDGNDCPDDRQAFGSQRGPHNREGRRRQRQPHIAERAVTLLALFHFVAALLEQLGVERAWIHWPAIFIFASACYIVAMPSGYIPILIFLAVAILFPVVTIIVAKLIRPSAPSLTKLEAYECGIKAASDSRGRYTVRFYIVAILFVIFDVETIFLFPWAVQYRKLGWFGVWEVAVFLGILVVGYIWAYKKGALEWV